jgi:hypothetical protein
MVSFFFWVSVTFQDLSYNMLPKKIKFILIFFLLKEGSSDKFTRVNLVAQTAHFLVNYVFGQNICSKKNTSGGKGKVNK